MITPEQGQGQPEVPVSTELEQHPFDDQVMETATTAAQIREVVKRLIFRGHHPSAVYNDASVRSEQIGASALALEYSEFVKQFELAEWENTLEKGSREEIKKALSQVNATLLKIEKLLREQNSAITNLLGKQSKPSSHNQHTEFTD